MTENTLEKKVSYEVSKDADQTLKGIVSVRHHLEDLDVNQAVQLLVSTGRVLDGMYAAPTRIAEMPAMTSRYNAATPGSVMEQEKVYALA